VHRPEPVPDRETGLRERTQRSGGKAPGQSGPPTPSTTEEELRRVTIGEPRRHDAPITLAEYDPRWTGRFSREERRIRKALGARVLKLEHVGSTSVPGLAAKPIIDILLVVANSADESAYVPPLEAEGYVLRIREPEWHQHRLLKGPGSTVNLHVFSADSEEVDRMVRFRDLLRMNPAARELYAQTKRELSGRTWRYVQNYADAKSKVVESILAGAPRRDRRRKGPSVAPGVIDRGRRARGDSKN
jgi:GrpB-like predicted nucleotidyltransferase (UPF0157 family)